MKLSPKMFRICPKRCGQYLIMGCLSPGNFDLALRQVLSKIWTALNPFPFFLLGLLGLVFG